jgi:hypothetical protein
MESKRDNQDKNKGGRPKKAFISLKSRTIGVCFSEPEYSTIRYRAEQANLPISIYCHDAILHGEAKEPIKKEDMETLRGLTNTGNNLNQLMRRAKFLGANQLEKMASVILEQIQNIINKLSDDWKNSKIKKF